MTNEEIIDNIARLNSETWRDREEVRTEIGKQLSELKKALEQQLSEDCVSRQAVLDKKVLIELPDGQSFYCIDSEDVESLPPVTPTQCIAAVRFSKEDLREICNERIEIECTHGTCKDCKNMEKMNCENFYCGSIDSVISNDDFYCAYYEKRGNEDG